MSSPETVLLHASTEMAHWARHYDAARFELTAVILAISGAAVSYAISAANPRVRKLLLIVISCVGVSLSLLSTEYARLYYERSDAAFRLRMLAIDYHTKEKDPVNFSKHKVIKHTYKGYLTAFGERRPSIEEKEDKEAAKLFEELYGSPGIHHWRWYMLPKLASSLWLWLNFGVGFILPVACLLLGIGRDRSPRPPFGPPPNPENGLNEAYGPSSNGDRTVT